MVDSLTSIVSAGSRWDHTAGRVRLSALGRRRQWERSVIWRETLCSEPERKSPAWRGRACPESLGLEPGGERAQSRGVGHTQKEEAGSWKRKASGRRVEHTPGGNRKRQIP